MTRTALALATATLLALTAHSAAQSLDDILDGNTSFARRDRQAAEQRYYDSGSRYYNSQPSYGYGREPQIGIDGGTRLRRYRY